MSYTDIFVDDFGWVAKLTVEQDGTAVDISAYTTTQMIFIDPSGTATTKTAAFDTDGSDGVLAYTVEDGLIDTAGGWRVFARIAVDGAEITTQPHSFVVEARPDA